MLRGDMECQILWRFGEGSPSSTTRRVGGTSRAQRRASRLQVKLLRSKSRIISRPEIGREPNLVFGKSTENGDAAQYRKYWVEARFG